MTIKNLFPVQRPYYQFNFNNTGSVDPVGIFTRSTVGSYVDGNGIIKQAGINEPRFVYNQNTREPLGLSIQPEITNHWWASDTIGPFTGSDSDWGEYVSGSRDPLPVTTGGDEALKIGQTPDGLTTTKCLMFSEVTDFLQQGIKLTSPAGLISTKGAYTASWFIKKVGTADRILRCSFRWQPPDINGTSYSFNYNWGTKKLVEVPGANSDIVPTITELSNGWVRFSILMNVDYATIDADQYTFAATFSSIEGTTESTIYSGDTQQGWGFYGFQLEEGTAASEYQSNSSTTSALTVARDSLQVLIPDPSNSPQTFIFDFSVLNIQTNTTIFTIDNGTAYIKAFINSSGYLEYSINGNSRSEPPFISLNDGTYTVALTWGAGGGIDGDFTILVAGLGYQTSLSVGEEVPTLFNRITLGYDPIAGVGEGTVIFKSIYSYYTELPPAELANLIKGPLNLVPASSNIANALRFNVNSAFTGVTGAPDITIGYSSASGIDFNSDFDVYWGDGQEQLDFIPGNQVSHDYDFTGYYKVQALNDQKAYTNYREFFLNQWKIESIEQWGDFWDSSEILDGLLAGCENLTSLPATWFDMSNATTIKDMFRACKSLTTIPTLTIDTSVIGSYDGLFKNCYSVQKVTINGSDNIDLPSVADMSELFTGCYALDSDQYSDNKFPNPPTNNATNLNGLFYGCSSIKEFRNALDLSKSTDNSRLFRDCTSLTAFPTMTFNTTSEWKGTQFAAGCTAITNWSTFIDTSKCTQMTSFFSTSNITAAPTDSGTPMDVTSNTQFLGCFQQCKQLTTYPDWDFSNGVNCGRVFYNSNKIGTVGTQPSQSNPYDFKNATTAYEIFLNNTALTECPWVKGSFDKVSSKYTGDKYVGLCGLHQGNKALTTFPADMFDVTTTDWFFNLFQNCTALTAAGADNIILSVLKARPNGSVTQDGTLTLAGTGLKVSDLSTATQNLIATRVGSDGWTITLDTTRSSSDTFKYVPIPTGLYRENGAPQYIWHGVYNLDEILTTKSKTDAPAITFEDFKLFRQQEWFQEALRRYFENTKFDDTDQSELVDRLEVRELAVGVMDTDLEETFKENPTLVSDILDYIQDLIYEEESYGRSVQRAT